MEQPFADVVAVAAEIDSHRKSEKVRKGLDADSQWKDFDVVAAAVLFPVVAAAVDVAVVGVAAGNGLGPAVACTADTALPETYWPVVAGRVQRLLSTEHLHFSASAASLEFLAASGVVADDAA